MDFASVIPTPILRDLELTPCDKVIYGVINSQFSLLGYSTYSNNKLAKMTGVAPSTVTTALNRLREGGHIDIVIKRVPKKEGWVKREIIPTRPSEHVKLTV